MDEDGGTRAPRLAEQEDADARTFALADFGSQSDEQGLYVRPPYRSARWPGEYLFECRPVLSLHVVVVP
jgi:hypothetical protein